jgi:hypothetical protein
MPHDAGTVSKKRLRNVVVFTALAPANLSDPAWRILNVELHVSGIEPSRESPDEQLYLVHQTVP